MRAKFFNVILPAATCVLVLCAALWLTHRKSKLDAPPKNRQAQITGQAQKGPQKTEIILPATIMATGQPGLLGHTFEEITAEFGDCVRGPDKKPAKTETAWPTTLPKQNNAQAHWDREGYQITAVWLPPAGPQGPAEIIRIKKTDGSTFSAEEIIEVLTANASQTWQKKPLSATRQRFRLLEIGPPQFAYWRFDGASLQINEPPTVLTLKSNRISTLELETLAASFPEPAPSPHFQ